MSGPRKDPPPGGAAEDELSLFEKEMAGVRPLDRRTGRVAIEGPAAPPPAPRPRAEADAVTHDRLSVVERSGETLTLLAPGVDRATVRELRASRRPEAELDLHGLTGDRARAALEAFVSRARGEGRRRVLVIHGRGHRSGPEGPVLRDRLVEALLERPLATAVLAAVTAPPALGGPGAAILLLRRR